MAEQRQDRDDHGRVVTSGAWAGALAAAVFLMWADARLPYPCAWLLNSTVVLGAAWPMARWKRAWYAWACFWGLAATCAVTGILKAATPLLDSAWSGASWVTAVALVGCWYWLVRAPARRPAAPPPVIHVVHHLAAPGAPPPGPPQAAVLPPDPAALPAPARPAIEPPPRASAARALAARLGIRRWPGLAEHVAGPGEALDVLQLLRAAARRPPGDAP